MVTSIEISTRSYGLNYSDLSGALGMWWFHDVFSRQVLIWSSSVFVRVVHSWDGNGRSSGMSEVTTASPKPSFRARWRVATPWSTQEMLGGQHQIVDTLAHPCPSKSGHPCTSLPMPELLTGASCRKSGRGSLLNRPSCPLDDPIGQGTEANWTDDIHEGDHA